MRVVLPDGKPIALSVKAAVATGPARRFIVGDPEILLIDVMAGRTLARMAAGARMAAKGEVVVDLNTATNLAQTIHAVDWRTSEATAERFAVLRRLNVPVAPRPWPVMATLEDTVVRPWLIQAVYERVLAGQGEFLTELRPAVALFIRFEGIDYDADEAAAKKLNDFVSWVQRVLARYKGFLIDVSIGDKGSYLYCAFGAPIAHENDTWRALTVALEVRTPPAERNDLTLEGSDTFTWAAPRFWEAGTDFRARFRLKATEGASVAFDLGSGEGRRRRSRLAFHRLGERDPRVLESLRTPKNSSKTSGHNHHVPTVLLIRQCSWGANRPSSAAQHQQLPCLPYLRTASAPYGCPDPFSARAATRPRLLGSRLR